LPIPNREEKMKQRMFIWTCLIDFFVGGFSAQGMDPGDSMYEVMNGKLRTLFANLKRV
jgi:hypothetical protein